MILLLDDSVVLFCNPQKSVMQDWDLGTDRFVSPFPVQMKLFNMHEATHFAIKFFILHALKHICSEVRVVEGPVLNFCNKYYNQET